jgi:hypothetical protein
MFPTLGGCLAANVHGKNNWQAGPLGEHVVEFEALLPNGQRVTCAPKQNEELFYAIISGMGLLGVFTSITLQMKKIYSGDMTITAWTEPNLAGMLTSVDAHKESDYVVGWVDAAAGGRSAGRGQIHSARYLKEGEDANPAATLRVEHQDLPARLLGVVPKSALPPLMAPFVNNFGAGLVNAASSTTSPTGSAFTAAAVSSSTRAFCPKSRPAPPVPSCWRYASAAACLRIWSSSSAIVPIASCSRIRSMAIRWRWIFASRAPTRRA